MARVVVEIVRRARGVVIVERRVALREDEAARDASRRTARVAERVILLQPEMAELKKRERKKVRLYVQRRDEYAVLE